MSVKQPIVTSRLFLFSFFILPFYLVAQEESGLVKKKATIEKIGFRLGINSARLMNFDTYLNAQYQVLHTGAVAGDLNLSGTFGQSPTIVFTIGMVTSVGLNKWLSLQPELLLMQAGGNFTATYPYNTNNLPCTINATLNYLQMPVLLKATQQIDNTYLYLQGGPCLGVALGGNMDISLLTLNSYYHDSEALKVSNLLSSSVLGMMAGAGIAIKAGKGELFLDARYYNSLNDAIDENRTGTYPNHATVYNRSVSFTVGYLHHLSARNH